MKNEMKLKKKKIDSLGAIAFYKQQELIKNEEEEGK